MTPRCRYILLGLGFLVLGIAVYFLATSTQPDTAPSPTAAQAPQPVEEAKQNVTPPAPKAEPDTSSEETATLEEPAEAAGEIIKLSNAKNAEVTLNF